VYSSYKERDQNLWAIPGPATRKEKNALKRRSFLYTAANASNRFLLYRRSIFFTTKSTSEHIIASLLVFLVAHFLAITIAKKYERRASSPLQSNVLHRGDALIAKGPEPFEV
jgi:hypothetical protein